jgi:hypothetical protein
MPERKMLYLRILSAELRDCLEDLEAFRKGIQIVLSMNRLEIMFTMRIRFYYHRKNVVFFLL